MKRKLFSVIATMALVLSLCFGGAAFAAPGDVHLDDFATYQTVRPNTYDSDYGTGDYFELQIIKTVEDSSGVFVPQFFSSAAEADPANFTWAQVSTTTGDSYIDIDEGEARELTPGNWYYYVVAYGGVSGNYVGPESWEATYSYDSTVASGDFTFVTTDFNDPDSGTTPLVDIEFYDGDPTLPADLIVSGDFATVSGNDDYATSPAHGRSYATALDAVAHSFYPAGIISRYAKEPGYQLLYSITDLSGNTYANQPPKIGWMYGVYYTDDGHNYVYDPDSYYIGPDDYKFKDRANRYPALVIWGIGDLEQYSAYFPKAIYR